jgi:23S rRNA (cytidine1920-2'-O)/16S rRNA (cytidine1409-2'-O)-methyltransferase
MSQKSRLDVLLVERGLAPTRAKAQGLIMAGQVFVAGQKRTKPGEQAPLDVPIEVRGGLPYVGRGGLKLAHALDVWGIDVRELVALDVGACTGGFTDVLLQRGARRVYAIDVGYGQLDYGLRIDPRVVVMERTNIRQLDALPDGELADCGVVDVSFISLRLVLPAMRRLMRTDAFVVALVKPQFEAGPADVGKGGIVRDPAVHKRVLDEILAFAAETGLQAHGVTRSPITGAEGNVEFLVWLGGSGSPIDVSAAIERVLQAD